MRVRRVQSIFSSIFHGKPVVVYYVYTVCINV